MLIIKKKRFNIVAQEWGREMVDHFDKLHHQGNIGRPLAIKSLENNYNIAK